MYNRECEILARSPCRKTLSDVAILMTHTWHQFGCSTSQDQNAWDHFRMSPEHQVPAGVPIYYVPGTLPHWAHRSARDFTPESAKRPAEAGSPLSPIWGGTLSSWCLIYFLATTLPFTSFLPPLANECPNPPHT
uniref:Uncharacterized protein n=1 Tax=Timema monikensis TaxID=170555 RepID=A0A7R9ELP1_9NEOP|nr:unnamed protein product [Timema monikensis]